MGDDITIGVTEIVNNIEVTAQPNDQIVELSVVDNADDVTLNITPTVIEINVNKGSSYAKWGTILGTLSDQEDLQDALDLKADLVDGKVPSSQLPSYVDDVIEVADYESLPTTGESGKIYITLDDNHIYRWTGSTYVEITDNTAVWGAITGTLSSQTDLQSALNAKQALLSGTGIVKSTSGTISYLTDNSNNWNTAYNDKINSASVTGTTTKTLTLNQQDGGTVTASWTDDNTDSVSSVFGRTGAVIAASGDYTTTQVTEGTNLYYTESRVNANTNVAANTAARHNAVTIGTANGLSLSTQALSLGLASSSSNGALSSTDWTTFNNKLSSLSGAVLTTTNQNIGGYKTFTEGAIILNNASNNLIDFQISGESVGNISLGSSYTQFTSKASNGYLFKNSVSNNSLAISDSGNGTFLGSITATSIIKSGGTSSQFLKADGSVDSSVYHTGSLATNYLPKATGSTTLGNSFIYDNGTNVGIGTTSPSEKLEVQNGAAGAKIKVSNSGGGYASLECSSNATSVTQLNFTNQLSLIGGNVGIGTTSPGALLHLNAGASNDTNLRVQSGAAGNHAKLTFSNSSNTVFWTAGYRSGTGDFGINYGDSFNSTGLTINTSGNVGIGTPSPSDKLDLFGAIRLTRTDDTAQYSTIQSNSNGSFIVTSYRPYAGAGNYGDFRFEGKDSTGATATQLYINTNGRVGIGTTSPSEKLHVVGNAVIDGSVEGYIAGLSSYRTYTKVAQFEISSYQSVSGSPYTKTMDIVSNADSGVPSEMRFLTAASGANPAERMRIKSNGVVNMDAMPYYTNNAAALAGGLTYGDLYYSTDASSATVKIVINFG